MGHIKIDRKILEWEWYRDLNTCRLFFHLLLRANWKEGRFMGVEIPRGSLATSRFNLSQETGLSERNIRTALEHLEKTGEVTSKKYSKFTVITVKNYDKYQAADQQSTSDRPATDQRSTTIEEGKKKKNKNNNISSAPSDQRSSCAGSFLLNDGTLYEITENDVENFQQLYPGIDVRQEIRNITGWCLSNPKNRKTRAGAKRFLNGWLSRSQNAARPEKRARAKPTGFSNFQQRDYDFDELEAQLLKSQREV